MSHSHSPLNNSYTLLKAKNSGLTPVFNIISWPFSAAIVAVSKHGIVYYVDTTNLWYLTGISFIFHILAVLLQ